VRAIAEAHSGRVAAGRSAEGGASIALDLPGFTPLPEQQSFSRPTRASADPEPVGAGEEGTA
jgi:hypothetical protein